MNGFSMLQKFESQFRKLIFKFTILLLSYKTLESNAFDRLFIIRKYLKRKIQDYRISKTKSFTYYAGFF